MAKKENKKSKVAGWSTAQMEEKASKHELQDTEEMLHWRSINQEGMNSVRISFRKIEEAVLEKCKVEVSKRGACKGRGDPSECRMNGPESQKISTSKVG